MKNKNDINTKRKLILNPFETVNVIPLNKEDKDVIIMGDVCHICSEVSYDDCSVCGRATCRKHGRRVGDRYVCIECVNNS